MLPQSGSEYRQNQRETIDATAQGSGIEHNSRNGARGGATSRSIFLPALGEITQRPHFFLGLV
jgi:hypothetical protein